MLVGIKTVIQFGEQIGNYWKSKGAYSVTSITAQGNYPKETQHMCARPTQGYLSQQYL